MNQKRNNFNIYSIYILLICINFTYRSIAQPSKGPLIDKKIITWVEDLLLNGKFILDTVNFSKENIKEKYHIFFREQKLIHQEKISIYSFGINIEPGNDMILIVNEKASNYNYSVIGNEGNSDTNLIRLYEFFDKYDSFSLKTKNTCYELIIRDMMISKEQIIE